MMAEGTRCGEMPSFEPSHSFEAQKRRFPSDGSKLRNTNAPFNSRCNFCLCIEVAAVLMSENGLLVMYVSINVSVCN